VNPSIIKGNLFQDHRGTLRYNNDFDASSIKRMYLIENKDLSVERAWQGHKIEQRWLSAINGSFQITLVVPDHWEVPTQIKERYTFTLESETLDILHIPSGFLSHIKSLSEDADLLVFSDYKLGEIADEYKFPLETFNF
jgi:dTDP-4-dehydrorhamnose 3,5-epimerase-like enzyme